jgi:hypothetical protein
MTLLILLAAVGAPLIMVLAVRVIPKLKVLYDGVAVACGYVFGIIVAFEVVEIVRHDTDWIHNLQGMLDNVAILGTGAYLGYYTLYRLLASTIRRWRNK